MRERHRLFEVTLATANGAETVEVWAETPHLALGLAESSTYPRGTAVSFLMRGDIIGRCRKCECYIEASDPFRTRRDELICGDCI